MHLLYAQRGKMHQKEMRDIIDRYILAYNSFDIDGMLALMHKDVIFKNISKGDVNMSTKGVLELRQAAEQAKCLFKSRSQKVENYSFEGDTVSVGINYEGVLAEDIPNGPKAGETLRLKGKSVFKFKDGLIVSLVDYS